MKTPKFLFVKRRNEFIFWFFEASGQYYRVLRGVANLNVNKATFRTMVNNPNNMDNVLTA